MQKRLIRSKKPGSDRYLFLEIITGLEFLVVSTHKDKLVLKLTYLINPI